MNIRITLALLMATLTVVGQSEKKVIRGKLIYRSCATTAIKIMDKAHYNLGQKTWQQAKDKPVFTNVFAVANACAFPKYKVGQLFTFTIIKSDPGIADCMTCMLYDNGPTKKQLIKVTRKPG